MTHKSLIGFVVPEWDEIHELIETNIKKFNYVIIPNSLEHSSVDLEQIDVLVVFSGSLTQADIDRMPKLAFVQALTAGLDTIDTQYLSKKKIVLADNNGINANAVAEHALALILALSRALPSLTHSVLHSRWQGPPPFIRELHELQGKTVGILGLGRIGTLLCRKLNGLNVEVIYYDRVRYEEKETMYDVSYVSLRELADRSDILSIHVPLTAQTHGMINHNFLSRMKQSAFLINTSRGAVVDTEALAKAVHDGMLEGAALDVFEREPIDSDTLHLLTHPRIILTPHRAGSSIENWRARIQFALQNIDNFYQGKEIVARIV